MIRPENMPGLDPEKTIVSRLSNCLIPTERSYEDGTIRINENFVKLMYYLTFKGFKGPGGAINNYWTLKSKEDIKIVKVTIERK